MISVCIATYNGERFIKEQLESILCQLDNSDEIVISDDGSTDNTISIIKMFNDSRIKLFENPNNKGVIHNFENALLKANGKYIFLADQDDIWKKNKVELVVKLLKDFSLVVHDAEIIDFQNKVISSSFFKIRNSGRGKLKNLYKNTYLGCCIAFNSNLLKYILPFPKNIPMHDIWIGNLINWIYQTHFYNEVLIGYRRHENNVTPTTGLSNQSPIKILKDRFFLLKSIILRIVTTK